MIASSIQLAAGIIFAVTVFVRKTWKDEDLHAQTMIFLNSTDGVNPRMSHLLYETYMFRFGTVTLCIGYLLPIGGIDYEGCNSPVINILAAIGIASIILCLSHLLSIWLKNRRIKKLSGFQPPSN